MNIVETLYDNEDLSTDVGIEAICEKIRNLNVSLTQIHLFLGHNMKNNKNCIRKRKR